MDTMGKIIVKKRYTSTSKHNTKNDYNKYRV